MVKSLFVARAFLVEHPGDVRDSRTGNWSRTGPLSDRYETVEKVG